MNYLKRAALLSLCMIVILSPSCKKEETAVAAPLGNEFLTTTILNLQNVNNPTDKPWIRYKLIGANPAIITTSAGIDDTLRLAHNASYTCNIVILDETKTPADTVSKVIKERANIHLFFFRPTPSLSLTDTITDRDTNVPPLPVGLQSIIRTGSVCAGSLEVILRHQPNVKNGTYPPGSTDLDVVYPVKIQ